MAKDDYWEKERFFVSITQGATQGAEVMISKGERITGRGEYRRMVFREGDGFWNETEARALYWKYEAELALRKHLP